MATITHDELSVCIDCVFMIANGEISGDPEAEERVAQAIAERWGSIGTLVLACPENCEGWFSWSPCDGCGSTLGGERHPAVAFDA